MMKNLALFALCFPFLVSCDNEVKKERLEKIDSLQSYLPEVEAILGRVDSTSIARKVANIERNTEWVFENVDDTLGRDFGIAFGEYGRLVKMYSKMGSSLIKLEEEYSYTKKQLKTLEKDVRNNFYSEEEFQGYFSTEEEAMLTMLKEANLVNDGYHSLGEDYNRLHAKVDSFITATKEIIYAPEKK